jgi:predicted GH43/DUF377 family glycosyl hydrolase
MGSRKGSILLLTLAVVVIIIILVWLFIVLSFSKHEKFEHTTRHVFGNETTIEKLPQIESSERDRHSTNFGFKLHDKFRTWNPSTVNVNNELIYVYRLSNATNCMFHKDGDFKVSSNKNIRSFIVMSKNEHNVDVVLPEVAGSNCAQGYEDPRVIVSPNGKTLYLLANALSGSNCKNEMYLVAMDAQSLYNNFNDITSIAPTAIKLNVNFDNGRAQKNWMPFFSKDSRLMMVYSINPHRILWCNTDTGNCELAYITENDVIPDNIRGGTQIHLVTKGLLTSEKWNNIPDEIYLGVTHLQHPGKKYVTQFYAFLSEPPYNVIAISPDFVFDDEKDNAAAMIQFASGFEILDNVAYVTYGIEDCSSRVCKIPMQSVLDSLGPLISKV